MNRCIQFFKLLRKINLLKVFLAVTVLITFENVYCQDHVYVDDFYALPQSGDAPLSVQFIDQTSDDTYSWSWYFEGGTPGSSSLRNPMVKYSYSGKFDVILIIYNSTGCDTIVKLDYIEVKTGRPIADFEASMRCGAAPLTVVFNDVSLNNPTAWLWEFTGGIPKTSTEKNPKVVYKSTGIFQVKLMAYNTKGSDEVVKVGFIEVYDALSMHSDSFSFGLEVFPNPASDKLFVNIFGKVCSSTILRLINTSGNIILEEHFQLDNQKFEIDVSKYLPGLYFIQMINNEAIISQKIQIR